MKGGAQPAPRGRGLGRADRRDQRGGGPLERASGKGSLVGRGIGAPVESAFGARSLQGAPDPAPRRGVRGGLGPPSKQVERGNGGRSPRTKQECISEANLAGVRGQVAPESETIGKFYPVILNGILLGIRSARPSVKRVTFVFAVNADNRVFSPEVAAVRKYAILGD